MKILIPVLGFGPSGGYRVLSRLATEWKRAGHHAVLLAPIGTPPPYHPTEAPVWWAGPTGPVVEQRPEAVAAARRRGLRNIASVWNGVRQLAANFDIVLANHSFTPAPIWLAGARRRSRFYYIQADEAEYYRDEHLPVHAAIARMSYALPFQQIVNAPVYFGYRAMRATEFVPPGVDLATFHCKSAARDFSDGAPIVIGCIGRREPGKGTQFLLDAYETLARSDARFRLRVAYGNLPEHWSHPGLEVVVPKNDEELATFYRSVDILVAPGTVQHGAPHYPVMEALASATPVVTTGYLPADADNSWIVANRDADAIADTVRAIVNDPAYYTRVERGLRAMQDFGWQAIAARMAAIFTRSLP